MADHDVDDSDIVRVPGGREDGVGQLCGSVRAYKGGHSLFLPDSQREAKVGQIRYRTLADIGDWWYLVLGRAQRSEEGRETCFDRLRLARTKLDGYPR